MLSMYPVAKININARAMKYSISISLLSEGKIEPPTVVGCLKGAEAPCNIISKFTEFCNNFIVPAPDSNVPTCSVFPDVSLLREFFQTKKAFSPVPAPALAQEFDFSQH